MGNRPNRWSGNGKHDDNLQRWRILPNDRDRTRTQTTIDWRQHAHLGRASWCMAARKTITSMRPHLRREYLHLRRNLRAHLPRSARAGINYLACGHHATERYGIQAGQTPIGAVWAGIPLHRRRQSGLINIYAAKFLSSGFAEQPSKSRFIARATHADSEQSVAAMLRQLATDYPNASHLAYAYRIKRPTASSHAFPTTANLPAPQANPSSRISKDANSSISALA